MAKKGKHTAPEPEEQAGRPKRRLLRRLLLLLAVTAVVVGVAVLTSMEDGVHLASLRRWLMYGDSSATQDFHVYTADSDNRYGQLGTGLLVASPNTIQFFRDSREAAYEISVRMKNPQLSLGSRQAAVCDVGGDTIYVLDQLGQRRVMNTDRGLCYYSARLNSSDYLAVTEQKNGYKAAVSVYNSSGEPVFHFDSFDNYISDAIVTSDCRGVVTVSLEAQGGVFASTLMVYDLDSARLTASRTIPDGLVMDLSCNNGRILSLCDKRFTITTLSGESKLDLPYGNLYLHDYTLDGDGFCALLLGRYQSGNICTLATYDIEGQQLGKLELTEEVLDISAAGDYLAVLYDESLVIYTSDLMEYTRLDDTQYAGQIQMEPDGTVLMISGSSAWRYLP